MSGGLGDSVSLTKSPDTIGGDDLEDPHSEKPGDEYPEKPEVEDRFAAKLGALHSQESRSFTFYNCSSSDVSEKVMKCLYKFRPPTKGDAIGGLTLGLILMSQSVAHAGMCKLTGVGLIHGPYSCMLPPLIYALFGSSKHGSVGTGGLVALLVGEFIGQANISPELCPVELQVICMTAITGVVLLGMLILNLQALVKFLSRAALSGFVNASAVLIIESQIRDIVGLNKPGVPRTSFLDKCYVLVTQLLTLDFTNYYIGLLGIFQLAILIYLKDLKKSKWLAELSKSESQSRRGSLQPSQSATSPKRMNEGNLSRNSDCNSGSRISPGTSVQATSPRIGEFSGASIISPITQMASPNGNMVQPNFVRPTLLAPPSSSTVSRSTEIEQSPANTSSTNAGTQALQKTIGYSSNDSAIKERNTLKEPLLNKDPRSDPLLNNQNNSQIVRPISPTPTTGVSFAKEAWLQENGQWLGPVLKLVCTMKDIVVVVIGAVICYYMTTQWGVYLHNVGHLPEGLPSFSTPPPPLSFTDRGCESYSIPGLIDGYEKLSLQEAWSSAIGSDSYLITVSKIHSDTSGGGTAQSESKGNDAGNESKENPEHSGSKHTHSSQNASENDTARSDRDSASSGRDSPRKVSHDEVKTENVTLSSPSGNTPAESATVPVPATITVDNPPNSNMIESASDSNIIECAQSIRVSGLWRHLFQGGAVVAFIVFLSSFAGAKKFSLQDGTYQVNATKELSALGLANFCGAFFGSVPVQVGLSRMAIGYESGVSSQWGANVIVATVIIGVCSNFTKLFFYVPQSTLAAIIISGALGLFDFNLVYYLWNLEPLLRKKRGFWIHCSAFLGTLCVGVAQGILFPVIISIVLLIKDATKLRVAELGRLPRTRIWRDIHSWKNARTVPGILVLRIDGNLAFANAEALYDEVTAATKAYTHSDRNPVVDTDSSRLTLTNSGALSPQRARKRGSRLDALVIDLSNVSVMDFSAIALFEELAQSWRKQNKWLLISGAQGKVRMKLERLLMPLIPNPTLLLSTEDGVQLAQKLIQSKDSVDENVMATSNSLQALACRKYEEGEIEGAFMQFQDKIKRLRGAESYHNLSISTMGSSNNLPSARTESVKTLSAPVTRYQSYFDLQGRPEVKRLQEVDVPEPPPIMSPI